MTSTNLTDFNRHFTIHEILNTEEYVICDSSVMESMIDEISSAKNFSEIPDNVLSMQLKYAEMFIELLDNSNLLTTAGVSSELKNSRDIIGQNLHYLSSRLKSENGKDKKYNHNGSNKKEMLEAIQELHHLAYESSKKKAFSPKNRQIYNFLERIVMAVAEVTDAKIDYGYQYSFQHKPMKHDFHTDEQLVASAVYLSCAEGNHGGILTRDSDIKRILRNTVFYIDHSSSAGYREIVSMIAKNPIKVYRMEGFKDARLNADSSWSGPLEISRIVSPQKIKIIDKIIFS